MIKRPFELMLSKDEITKLGELMLTWSNLEHMLGNCLMAVLDLTHPQAIVMVFPLTMEQRLRRLSELDEKDPGNPLFRAALAELKVIVPAIQYVRNNVAHAIIIKNDAKDEATLHLRSKERDITIGNVLQAEELSNYACHVIFGLRTAIGDHGIPWIEKAWPDRPEIPEYLQGLIPTRKK